MQQILIPLISRVMVSSILPQKQTPPIRILRLVIITTIIEDVDESGESNNTTTTNTTNGTTTIETTTPTGEPGKPIPIVGFITLELLDTPDLMTTNQRDSFVDITEAFLSFNIFFGSNTFDIIEITFDEESGENITTSTTYIMPLLNEEGIMVSMTRQSRTLLLNDENYRQRRQQQGNEEKEDIFNTSPSTLRPLYITLQVTGIANEPTGDSNDTMVTVVTNSTSNTTIEAMQLPDLELFNFNGLLQSIFIEKQIEYVEALQITGNDYFNFVDQVTVLLDSTILGPGIEYDVNQTGTMNPDDKDSIGNTDGTIVPSSNNDEQSTSPLSMGAIIGIAVGGGVFVLCCFAGLLYFCCCRSNKGEEVGGGDGSKASAMGGVDALEKPSTSTGPTTTTPQSNKRKPWNRGRRSRNSSTAGMDGPVDSMAEQHLMSTDNSSNKPDDDDEEASSSVDLANDTDLESQAMYSYNPRGDSGSVYTASNSIMMSGGGGGSGAYHSSNRSYYNDNMSYAYSLEPGIEASVIDGVLNNTTMSMMVDDSVRSRVPIREIPQISAGAGASSGTTPKHDSATSPSSIRSGGFGNTKIETAPSDLKLTESELAMLPSNLRSADEDDETSPADTSGFTATNTNYVTRKVSAPPGKLGIVIDTTVEGPVVHNVNNGSRLTGKIYSGDIIIAIDDVDTRAMSASAITALMVKTANQQRTLTVRRSNKSEK